MMDANEPAAPGSEVNTKLKAAVATLSEMVEGGEFTPDESISAVAIGCGVIKLLKENKKPSVPVDEIIMWLGQWRGSLPGQAIHDLQEICRKNGYGN